jgi:orotate phosphoribosyltransferase-like protein
VLVVVDDVVSSGATLTEAARALGGGISSDGDMPVLGAVVAATPRRSGTRSTQPGPAGFTVRWWGGP